MNPPLTYDELTRRLDYDSSTGEFRWKIDCQKRFKGASAGTVQRLGYKVISIDKVRYYAHRLAWFFVHGQWPKGIIDHVNHDTGDNRIENLRDCDWKGNAENIVRPQKNNKCGLLGVCFLPKEGRWLAQICHNRKHEYLGRHRSAEAAHDAYIKRKRELHAFYPHGQLAVDFKAQEEPS